MVVPSIEDSVQGEEKKAQSVAVRSASAGREEGSAGRTASTVVHCEGETVNAP